jgi:hypothetical protein
VQIANTAVTGLFEAGFRILNPAGQEFAAGSTGNTTDVIPACSANLVGPGTGTIQINGVTYNTDCSVP